MDLDFRSTLRVVLIAGGVGYVLWGVLDSQRTLVLVGGLALVVGLLGLYREGIGGEAGQ